MSTLASLDREYSLYEIAIMTRAGPAKQPRPQGPRPSRGRRRADITVYDDEADRESMFATPELVFKNGELIVRSGKVVKVVQGATHVVRPQLRPAIEKPLKDYFDRYHTMRMENFRLADEEIVEGGRGQHHRATDQGQDAMKVNGIAIDDTFAEAFGMSAHGLVITADRLAGRARPRSTMTGFGTSVIGCGAEVGIDRELAPDETPDGRPGVRVLLFGFSPEALAPQLKNRVGQCVLTSPGLGLLRGRRSREAARRSARACASSATASRRQSASASDRYWRMPVMDGEFVIEETTGVVTDAVGGGNLLILGDDRAGLLATAEAAVAAIAEVPDVITPFPGGIVRSGSKVGSKYKGMIASTNDAFCPTLRGRVKSELGPDTVAVLEIVIDGLTSKSVADAMKAGLKSIIDTGAARGVTRVSAGNYGGKLGQHHYRLRELLP